MRHTFATLLTSALLLGGAALPADAAVKNWKPCKYEDSKNCVWDAKHRGNGKGRSFICSKKGKITFISHKRAHRLLNR